jgi:hypothetical protein
MFIICHSKFKTLFRCEGASDNVVRGPNMTLNCVVMDKNVLTEPVTADDKRGNGTNLRL